MAEHRTGTYTGAQNIEALTEDRMRMWSGFTNAIVIVASAIVLLLIAMAFFLL